MRHTLWTCLLLLILTWSTWRSVAAAQPPSCHHSGVTCLPLSGPGTAPPTCYGAALGFSHTALLWANDSASLADVTSRLKQWEGLSSVPECWAVVQPFLCSVYLPKCDSASGRVDYPSLELCEKTREPCGLVEKAVKHWPQFLRCSQPYFKQNCGTGVYDQLTYNRTGRCDPPLVRTTVERSWWGRLEGCGVQCEDPLFTPAQHQQARVFVAITGGLCVACTLFTILTFLIDWQNAGRYPALILFFINVCFLLAALGWMAQFTQGARRDIVCRLDGTKRKAEPQLGSGESAACTVVFVMVYYFTMAGLLWFIMLCYAWHVTFRALGTPRDDLSSKTAYFHLFSWSTPLVLTIVCLAISEIDGDSLSGICFVGYHNHSVRAGFVLLPVACALVFGLFFLVKGLLTLTAIKKDAPEFVGEKAAAKITETIVRIGIFLAFALVFGVMTFGVHIYIFVKEQQWTKSLDDYLYCMANRTVSRSAGSVRHLESCSMDQRPSLFAMEVNILAFFGAGVIMSSWSWTKASLAAWGRFLKKMFQKSSDKSLSHHHHRMIAQTYEKHGNNGRVSVSYQSTHDDPLDVGSVMSHDSQQGRLMYLERDNSSNNGSLAGHWRRRRRRRRKRRKKRVGATPILGPVLSGVGFASLKPGALRRGSHSSEASKMSTARPPGSVSSMTANDRIPLGGAATGSGVDIKGPSHRLRRKLPRLAPLHRQRRRSLSSSRSSLSQWGMHSSFPQAPYPLYPHMYPGLDYSQLYGGMGYPHMAYPFWPPYPYPPAPMAPPPGPPAASQPPTSAPPSTADFSLFSSPAPGATSTPNTRRKHLVTAATSRRSEVTIETQQTQMISMQDLQAAPDLKAAGSGSEHDDSEEDLNSSQLEDSAEEDGNDNSTVEAEAQV